MPYISSFPINPDLHEKFVAPQQTDAIKMVTSVYSTTEAEETPYYSNPKFTSIAFHYAMLISDNWPLKRPKTEPHYHVPMKYVADIPKYLFDGIAQVNNDKIKCINSPVLLMTNERRDRLPDLMRDLRNCLALPDNGNGVGLLKALDFFFWTPNHVFTDPLMIAVFTSPILLEKILNYYYGPFHGHFILDFTTLVDPNWFRHDMSMSCMFRCPYCAHILEPHPLALSDGLIHNKIHPGVQDSVEHIGHFPFSSLVCNYRYGKREGDFIMFASNKDHHPVFYGRYQNDKRHGAWMTNLNFELDEHFLIENLIQESKPFVFYMTSSDQTDAFLKSHYYFGLEEGMQQVIDRPTGVILREYVYVRGRLQFKRFYGQSLGDICGLDNNDVLDFASTHSDDEECDVEKRLQDCEKSVYEHYRAPTAADGATVEWGMDVIYEKADSEIRIEYDSSTGMACIPVFAHLQNSEFHEGDCWCKLCHRKKLLCGRFKDNIQKSSLVKVVKRKRINRKIEKFVKHNTKRGWN